MSKNNKLVRITTNQPTKFRTKNCVEHITLIVKLNFKLQ